MKNISHEDKGKTTLIDKELVKALRCLSSQDGNGDCHIEHHNVMHMDGGTPEIYCGNEPHDGRIQCPYYQNKYDVCFEDGECCEWLRAAADKLEKMSGRLDELEGRKEDIKWLKWENGKEWGEIECPMLGGKSVMTYYPEGAPCYYSYTAPFVSDGDTCYYRYDHDEGCWDGDTLFCMGEYKEGTVIKFSE